MRHGRKSRSKRFDGYKEHIARDLDFPRDRRLRRDARESPRGAGRRAHRRGHQAASGFDSSSFISTAPTSTAPSSTTSSPSGGTVFAKPWGSARAPTRACSPRATSRSTCAPRPSPAPLARWSPSSPATPSSSTPKRAAHAPCAPSAPRPHRAAAAPSPSPPTKPGNASTASSSRPVPGRALLRAAHRRRARPRSHRRTQGTARSLRRRPQESVRPAPRPPPSRTSRVSIGWRAPRNHRQSQRSHHVRRSRDAMLRWRAHVRRIRPCPSSPPTTGSAFLRAFPASSHPRESAASS